jgi:hypothetical protein
MIIFIFCRDSIFKKAIFFSVFFVDVFYPCVVSCDKICHSVRKIFRNIEINDVIKKISEKKYNKKLKNNIVFINRKKSESLENISEDLRVRTKIYKKDDESSFFKDNLERVDFIFNSYLSNKDFFAKLNNKCLYKYDDLYKSISYILYLYFSIQGIDKITIINNIRALLINYKYLAQNFKFNENCADLKEQMLVLKEKLISDPFIFKLSTGEKNLYFVGFLGKKKEIMFINVVNEKEISEKNFVSKYFYNKKINKFKVLYLKDILSVIFKER